MKKSKILLFLTTAILISLGAVIFLTWRSNNKIVVTKPPVYSPPSPLPTLPNRGTLNKNGYPFYMLEGTINKIYSLKPLKLGVNIEVFKIIPNQTKKEILKTITAKEDTEFVINNLTTKKDSKIELSSFKVGEHIVIWTIEPNTDIFNLDQFTATKIIKFQ